MERRLVLRGDGDVFVHRYLGAPCGGGLGLILGGGVAFAKSKKKGEQAVGRS